MPDSIAHYRIAEKLGQGAMGEVYRATDTKLGRDVAVKLIAPSLVEDRSRMASFTREAQVLASLNHPNIAAIYGVEDQALVMELVEGPTLAERIKQGPIPVAEALAIARQIADALAAAHDKGIVHRDLKPANIKITPDGVVKLLDFGLAKAAATANVASGDAATVAFSMASAGMIVGTPGYMAPEQARGQDVDKRADIWAFGVVLYEMLTGTTLYSGDTITDVMAAVVREEPDLTRVPATVRPLLRRCLEKEPKRRLRDIGDAMLLLETVAETASVAPPSGRRLASLIPWGAAAALLVALVALAVAHFREAPPDVRPVRFTFSLPEGVSVPQNAAFTLSPDGRLLAFPAVGTDGGVRIWIHDFSEPEPKPLPADVTPSALTLAWSPDSRYLLYPHDNKFKRIAIAGGAPLTIVEAPGQPVGAAWSGDTIVYGAGTAVMKVPAGGGTATALTKADTSKGEVHGVFGFLPDGRHFLYTRGGPVGKRALYVGSIDANPDAQDSNPVITTDFGGRFVPLPGSANRGHLLFVHESRLMAQRFDPRTRMLEGDPTVVAPQVFAIGSPSIGVAYVSASDEGTLIYRTGTVAGFARQLFWFGRDGKTIGTVAERARYQQLKLSPDGSRILSSRTDINTGSNADIWITDVATNATTRLTFAPEADAQPTWSPDGRFIAWAGARNGKFGVYRKPADGSGDDELLYQFDTPQGGIILSDWSATGYLVTALGGDIFALPIGPGTDASRKLIPVVQTMAREFGPDLSPDGRWLAYISDETGRQELYVRPFAPAGGSDGAATPITGKWMVSKSGTLGLARWRQDSKELLFVDADGNLMSVDVAASPVFKSGIPQKLFALPRPFLTQTPQPGTLADVASDGQRLLLAMPSDESTRPELSVVLNWQAD